ncbi:MAG: hypothetical protein RIB98_17805 [Acidimicrobiales bacterium]
MLETPRRSLGSRLTRITALLAGLAIATAITLNQTTTETSNPTTSVARVVTSTPDQPTPSTVVIGDAVVDSMTTTSTSTTTTIDAATTTQSTPVPPSSTVTTRPTTTGVVPSTTVGPTLPPRPPTSTTTVATTVAPATTSPPPTTTVASGYFAQMYLGSNGAGPANWVLPVGSGTTQGPLPNYDTNHDDDPGRTIVRTAGDPLPDVHRVQFWNVPVKESYHAVGTPRLELWAAAADFDRNATIELTASLSTCHGYLECEELSTRSVAFRQADFGGGFGRVSVVMPAIDTIVPAGDYLLIGLSVPLTSGGDAWVAFDSSDYPSRAFLD